MIRPASASGEKPPNTTEWTAPIRAQASIATTPSTTIGMYSVTRAPLVTPIALSALAILTTSACNCA